ncbi:MAG: DUF4145 domain-containing protein [Rubripirellula sp.]
MSFGGGFGGMGAGQPKKRAGIHFHAAEPNEQQEVMHGMNPLYRNFDCGHCGRSTNGRVVCSETNDDDETIVFWCHCSCDKRLPTLIVAVDGSDRQFPEHARFQAGENWPAELERLYQEASLSFTASAYTSTTMVARKILMVCACNEGAAEGLSFVKYVDYIVDNVLPLPKAKASIDAIRTIGNDANHSVAFVSRNDAMRAMSIVTYLLNSVYSLPES